MYEESFFWEVPSISKKSNYKNSKAKGIVLLFHGCSHKGEHFFKHTDFKMKDGCDKCKSTCTKTDCIGLPAEEKIATEVLRSGYIALSITSSDRNSKCWSKNDVSIINKAVNEVVRLETLEDNYKIFAFGASSGGTMALHLGDLSALSSEKSSLKFRIDGIISQIAIPQTTVIESNKKILPPTVIITMSRDMRQMGALDKIKNVYDKLKIPILIQIAKPKKMNTFLFQHYGISSNLAKKIVDTLEKGKLLNNSYLKDDPRLGAWRDLFKQKNIIPASIDTLQEDNSAISEIMNIGYSMHEMTGEYIFESIRWLEKEIEKKEKKK